MRQATTLGVISPSNAPSSSAPAQWDEIPEIAVRPMQSMIRPALAYGGLKDEDRHPHAHKEV
jgi:hypothetical protein